MFLYSLLLLIGGLVGFYMSGSSMSLIVGCASAAVGFIAWYGFFRSEHWAYALGTVLAILLGIFFSYRYYETGKVAPGLVFAILSFLEAGYLSYNRYLGK